MRPAPTRDSGSLEARTQPLPVVSTATGRVEAAPKDAAQCDEHCCSRLLDDGSAPPAEDRTAPWRQAARRARWLAWASLAWMTIEGGLGLLAGALAGSLALVAWALGSVIEGLASGIVIWRFSASRTLADSSEARAQRAVAVSFFLLAPYIAIQAIHDLLIDRGATSATRLGLIVTASSLVVMPLLGVAKRRLGAQLGSGATSGEGTQNLLCAAQAAAVLAGLAVTAAVGWTWVDPLVALLLAGWAVREGVQTWGGQCC